MCVTPEAWFHLAAQMDQDCAMEDTFRRQVNIPSPATLPRTSLLPQPAPPTPACHLHSDSPSRGLVRICTNVVSKAETPRERCAAHTVLCPLASTDEALYARSPTAILCSSPAFAEVSSVTAPAPAEEATEQVLNPTGTLDASQGAFTPPPVVPPSTRCSSLLGCMYSRQKGASRTRTCTCTRGYSIPCSHCRRSGASTCLCGRSGFGCHSPWLHS